MKYSFHENLWAILERRVRYRGDDGEYHYRPVTRAEAAKAAGVSTRTLRRWINEGRPPSEVSLRNVSRVAAKYRAELRRHNQREVARTGKKQSQLPDLPTIPFGQRRKLKRYRGGKPTGEYKYSDWVNYDISRMRFADILVLLYYFRGKNGTVEIIYEGYLLASSVNKGTSIAYEIAGVAFVRVSTGPEYLKGRSDGSINKFADSFCIARTVEYALQTANTYPQVFRPLYLGVLDR